MPLEPRKPENSPSSAWNLDDFMHSQADALYLKSRDGVRASLGDSSMDATTQPRIGERREGFERRREVRPDSGPERRAIERRRGAERRTLGGMTSP